MIYITIMQITGKHIFILIIVFIFLIFLKCTNNKEDFIPVDALTSYDDIHSTVELMHKVDKFLIISFIFKQYFLPLSM